MPRRFLGLILVLLLLAGGWTAFWVVVAGEVESTLDGALREAAAAGADVTCDGREVSGFPFRMEVRCDALAVRLAGGGALTGGALRAVALAYNPRHVIVEADAPLSLLLGADGPRLDARWRTARSSARIDAGAPDRLAVSLTDLDATLSGFVTQRLAAELLELHVRRVPDAGPEAADVAVTLAAATLDGPVSSPRPFDAAALLQVPKAGRLLGGEADLQALIGSPVTVHQAYLARDDARLSAAGILTLGADGQLSGDLEVTAREPQRIAELLAPFYPAGSNVPAAFQGAMTGLGRKSTDGPSAVSATLRLRDGRISIGLIPIAQTLPLF